MDNSIHIPVKESVHSIEMVDKMLTALGYNGVDDYVTAKRSKDLQSDSEVCSMISSLGYPTDGELINTVRTILKDHNVPFTMVHKRDGNYLQLTPPKTDLADYLSKKRELNAIRAQAELKRPAIPADFSYKDYLSKLNVKYMMSLDVPAIRGMYDSDCFVELETRMIYGPEDYYVLPDKKQLILTIPRCCDALYGITLYICDGNGVVLRIVKDPEIQSGSMKFRPLSMDSALYLMCLLYNGCTITTDHDIHPSLPLRIVVMCNRVTLNSNHRAFLSHANDVHPMYFPRIVCPKNSLFSDREVTLCVHQNKILLPPGGSVYNIRVHGRRSLGMIFGLTSVPINTEYDKTTNTTRILDFTSDNPILYYLMMYDTVVITTHDQCHLTVTYEIGRMPESIPSLTEITEVNHRGYIIRYKEGSTSLFFRI